MPTNATVEMKPVVATADVTKVQIFSPPFVPPPRDEIAMSNAVHKKTSRKPSSVPRKIVKAGGEQAIVENRVDETRPVTALASPAVVSSSAVESRRRAPERRGAGVLKQQHDKVETPKLSSSMIENAKAASSSSSASTQISVSLRQEDQVADDDANVSAIRVPPPSKRRANSPKASSVALAPKRGRRVGKKSEVTEQKQEAIKIEASAPPVAKVDRRRKRKDGNQVANKSQESVAEVVFMLVF
jgi:hypothetical protein